MPQVIQDATTQTLGCFSCMLDWLSVPHWVMDGSLLQLLRDGHSAPWDGDIDVGVLGVPNRELDLILQYIQVKACCLPSDKDDLEARNVESDRLANMSAYGVSLATVFSMCPMCHGEWAASVRLRDCNCQEFEKESGSADADLRRLERCYFCPPLETEECSLGRGGDGMAIDVTVYVHERHLRELVHAHDSKEDKFVFEVFAGEDEKSEEEELGHSHVPQEGFLDGASVHPGTETYGTPLSYVFPLQRCTLSQPRPSTGSDVFPPPQSFRTWCPAGAESYLAWRGYGPEDSWRTPRPLECAKRASEFWEAEQGAHEKLGSNGASRKHTMSAAEEL
eukprot:TRINITY_DN14378_c0_g1_i3.p1 TRINITY_DN14378_c0_g1~~TRINITY_DN14378_c0_g1_i3.p1  ORF type:complete len:335 (-),score=42.08 TRINITY_DN14378_c0_g1_i3:109-1113(-)